MSYGLWFSRSLKGNRFKVKAFDISVIKCTHCFLSLPMTFNKLYSRDLLFTAGLKFIFLNIFETCILCSTKAAFYQK